jgi:hypothetical protein
MSRSYRHSPVITDQSRGSARLSKRQASKAARRCSLLSGKGKRYRKCFDTWKICDYRARLWKAIRSKYFDGNTRQYWTK